MKSGNLNFLEPSGPLQACKGTALPLPLPCYIDNSDDRSIVTANNCYVVFNRNFMEVIYNTLTLFEIEQLVLNMETIK